MFENGGARGDNGPSSEASRNAPRRYCGDGMLVSADSRSTRLATSRAEGANNTLECRMQHAAC